MIRIFDDSRWTSLTAVCVLGAASVLNACGGGDPGGEDVPVESSGSLDLALDVGESVKLRTVAWEITGNGLSRSGTFNVEKSTRIAGTVGGIPAGSGYTVALSAVDTRDSSLRCVGSAGFDVSARQTSTARVRLVCTLPPGNGSVKIEGTTNVCPRIDGLSADPAETTVGNTVNLAASATEGDRGPAPLAYSWSSSSGLLTNASTPNPTFTCTGEGEVSLTLTVTDGECGDTASLSVSCSPPGGGAPPPVKVNEVESQAGVPGDWAELYNAGSSPADVSGWRFIDNDDTHTAYTIPAGTIVQPGAFLVLDESAFGFGLGAGDSARLYDTNGTLVDSYVWTAHAPATYGRCPDGSGAFRATTSATKGTANDCSVPVKLNEVESNGGTPGDWVELFNPGVVTVDLTGFVFKDNDDAHAYALPAGTTLAPGAYLVLEEATFGFGLGGADSARLFAADGATLVDSYAWTAHATTSYARCPSGTGGFTTSTGSSKGSANDCPGIVTLAPWPGSDNVQTADGTSVFGGNLSGLTYEGATAGSPAVLWAVRNGPGTLYRLVESGSIWTPDTANDWGAGKALRYPDGSGNPDSEGVTRAEAGGTFLYVATERNNDASTISRPSILRVDAAAPGSSLTASHEWALVADLPAVGANLGPEAIAFVPDAFLTASAFHDEAKGRAYDPSDYPGNGGGLFFVSLEANGTIYAYALDHGGSGFTRVATIASGFPGSMGIEFDREVGFLWAVCDDTCEGQSAVLRIDTEPSSATFGRFVVRRKFARPTTLANLNNEGIAIAPEAECVSGQKPFFWSDDGESGGHSIRRDTIPCSSFF